MSGARGCGAPPARCACPADRRWRGTTRLSRPRRVRPEARRTSRNAHAPHSLTLGRRCNGGVHMRRSARCVRAHGRGLRRSRSPCASSARLAAPITQHYAQHRDGAAAVALAPSSDDPRASRLGACAGRTRSTTTSCRRKPFWAVLPIGSDSHDPHRNAHAHASGGGRPGAIQLRTSLHPAWAAQRAQPNEHTAHQAERPAHRPARAALCYSYVRGPGRTHSGQKMRSRPFLCANRRLVSVLSSCPLEVARRRRIRALRPTSMRSRPSRGRMRRPGASCAATKDA